MKTLSSLDEVAKYLEQHENSTRIKKLIFCACTNIWENDQNKLNHFKLPELIQELCTLNPTLDSLELSLSKVVKSLNKQAEYSLFASVVFNEVQKLYIIKDEEATGILLNQPNQEKSIFYNSGQISSKALNQSPNSKIKSQYDQFDLRQNIMKYTNPLRAKIILFSVLYHKFTFQEEDWFKLRAEELDSLLQKLFDSCSTLRELEFKLNNSVISLGNPDENTQVASAIIQSMRGLYRDISSTSATQDQPINSYSSQETRPLVDLNYDMTLTEVDHIYENDIDDENTCQFIVPPTKNMFNKKQ
ncbi:hypothetical protein [Trichormus variabilis]|uniref:Uncharacterized protein n=1 Tax=Trichormus variabilis SAG 1403-4b TaxID=447716 RepID=A0A433UIP5_ANAVA|nr:hypothetical protein [Trichormus variabilis]MBD2628879.1 hypothetical protein [Trichormus variabilis FACHB-164]RUS93721.1 hypothetical protein DSM107003_42220 [Trichormus variabilis SAG 1403-4b]